VLARRHAKAGASPAAVNDDVATAACPIAVSTSAVLATNADASVSSERISASTPIRGEHDDAEVVVTLGEFSFPAPGSPVVSTRDKIS
jgi:hypothetical protein